MTAVVPGRVSVVIPCYNGERYLREAIDSALAQTYPDVEVIVADDGSTDGTAAIASSFPAGVLVVRQRNAGPSAARNAALRVARGEYVALLDHDDRYHPEKLAGQVALLRERPTAGMAYCGWRFVDASGRVLPEHGWPRVEGDLWRQLVRGNLFHPVAVVLRRELVDGVGGFDESLPVNEDWDLFLRASRTGATWACLDAPLCDYRVHPGQSHTRLRLVHEHALRIVDKTFRAPGLTPAERALERPSRQQAHLRAAADYARADDLDAARAALAEAVRLDPSILYDTHAVLRFLRMLLPEATQGRAEVVRHRRDLTTLYGRLLEGVGPGDTAETSARSRRRARAAVRRARARLAWRAAVGRFT